MNRTRRTFLVDLGRTTAGLVVMGTGLAACGSQDDVAGEQATATPATPATPASPSTPTSTGPTTSGTAPSLVDLDFVAAYVLVRDGEAAIVDTGVSGSEAAILAVLESTGLGWSDVSHVIVTHNHGDHAGSLNAVATAAAGAALYAGAEDIPVMTAPREITAVGDGDRVFDLRIVATPGHTPGHISVVDEASRFLVTGDALVGRDGQLAGPDPQFTPDMQQAIASVAKLATLDVDEVLVAHGFPVSGAGTAQLAALAASL